MKINAYNDKDLIYIALGDVNCSMENILKILEKLRVMWWLCRLEM